MHAYSRTSPRWLGHCVILLALAQASAGCGDTNPPASGSGGDGAGGGPTPAAGSAAVAGNSATQGGTSAGGSTANPGAGMGGSGAGAPSPNGGTAGSAAGGSAVAGGSGGSSGSGGGGSGGSSGSGNTSAGSTLIPDASWTCGKPGGIVDPAQGKLVFTASIDIGQVREVGATQFGKRRVADLTGGELEGGELEATLLPGGIDFELELSSGAIELEQVAMLRAKDNSLIYLRTCGLAPAGESVVRFVPDFEVATSSSLAWLNTGNFVGTRRLDVAGKTLELAVYDVSSVKAEGPSIQLKDPAGVPHQSWECVKASGTKGSEVFTETVTLGGSLSVGASKRGSRNVIPITGGSVSGKFTGTVVGAGADYQLVGGTTTLDARYLLSSNDGEVVVVRNCGPFGALIPVFEARSAGPYGFLNTGKYISSDPGSAAGGVKITFYTLN